MNFLRGFAPQTITAQITSLVIIAVLLGVGLASAVLFYLFYTGQAGPSAEIIATARAARIAAIVKKVEESRSPTELARMLDMERSPSVDVEQVPVARLASMPSSAAHNPDFVSSIKTKLEDTWGIVPLSNAAPLLIGMIPLSSKSAITAH